MVVPRLDIFRLAMTRNTPNFYQRNAIAEEGGKRQLLWLKGSIRKLHAESDPKPFTFRGIESKSPHRIEVESSRSRLNVAPIAADVQHIHKRQARYLLDMLLQRFASGSGRQRGATFLPRISHQAEARIAKRLLGWRCEKHSLPSLILIDIKRAL